MVRVVRRAPVTPRVPTVASVMSLMASVTVYPAVVGGTAPSVRTITGAALRTDVGPVSVTVTAPLVSSVTAVQGRVCVRRESPASSVTAVPEAPLVLYPSVYPAGSALTTGTGLSWSSRVRFHFS